jgi:hypothetical protein
MKRIESMLRRRPREPVEPNFSSSRLSARFAIFFVMRFDMPVLGQWALLIIAFVIIVMIVLGVSTTKLWFWDLLSS